jgi:hypothetical protein
VTSVRPGLDPYLHDPSRWGASMAHHAELLLPCLDAVGARTVYEVGALAGDLTSVLAQWAAGAGAGVVAIDPAPGADLVRLADDRPHVELVRRTSLDALPELPPPDAVVLDGDHNHFTVSGELAALEAAADGTLPLVLLHDVCWPHGRRDDYFAPEQIPADRRHPVAPEGEGLVPGDPGTRPDGLPYPRSAAREGGPGNGVLTAVEDFAADRPELQVAVVPAFFGFGAVWDRRAAWADEVAAILAPWDRNPLLRRLEDNRLHQLATAHARYVENVVLRERLARREALLRRQLESSAFSVAGLLSRLRVRAGVAPAQSVISKDEIRRVLADQD